MAAPLKRISVELFREGAGWVPLRNWIDRITVTMVAGNNRVV